MSTEQAGQSGDTPRQQSPIDEVRSALGKMAAQFKAVMPTQEHVDRFIRVTVTAVQQNSKLLEANRTSFYAACMKAAQDGLLPDGKEALLNIYPTKTKGPNGDVWVDFVQYQPMVEGMMKKLRLSGEIIGAPKVHVVREADEFEYELGDNERIVHKPAIQGDRGKIIAAYSIVKLKSGDTSREVIGIDGILEVRARSKAKDSGPWKIVDGKHSEDFGEMAKKTVFRRHTKRLPKSSDFDNILRNDDDTFVPFAEQRQEPGTAVASGPQPGDPVGAQASAAPAASARPAALASVVAQSIPAMKIDQREPVTIDAQASQSGQAEQAWQSQQAEGGPPRDII